VTDRSAAEIWKAALGELQIQVTRSNYETWLSDTVGLSYQRDQFIVGTPSVFAAEWLDKRLLSLIRKTLMGIIGRRVEVKLEVCRERGGDISLGTGVTDKAQPEQAADSARWARRPRLKLNPRYTFDTFIVGSCNRLAHAAALGVAENPGHGYNPLFIYGGVGLGKTHLLHAIGSVALGNELGVLLVSGEQFTNEFISAIRDGKTKEFRDKFRNVDLLLMDDIQFISGKEQTQEAFFHTFNDLHNSNRQIVVSSDRPPKSMPLLEERLRSRFEWGLLVDIQPPDLETRIAILQAKARQQMAVVSQDVLEYIAHKVQKNIRELEGSLNRVVAYARLTRAIPTVDLAERVLRDMTPVASPRISPGAILGVVCRYFNSDLEALKGSKRKQHLALVRQIAMYIIREEARCPLAEIGQLLGGRDHSTVLHGCQKIAADINVDPQLRRDVLAIREMLHASPVGGKARRSF
jgi:chromosomal replication initiator protein